MNSLYFILILSVFFLPFSTSNVSAQSYDLKDIDVELCKIYNVDQQIRKKIVEIMQKPSIELISIKNKMDSIDTKNQIYVSNLLDNHGWPDNLSDSANNAIFLVIDHGDKSYSEKYFEMVKEKAEQGIISKSDAAILEDRILMRANKPQMYGTQTKSDIVYYLTDEDEAKSRNVIYIWPIENPEKVDELRISVGLQPINTYIQQVEEMYQIKVVWDKNLKVKDFKDEKQRNKKSK